MGFSDTIRGLEHRKPSNH